MIYAILFTVINFFFGTIVFAFLDKEERFKKPSRWIFSLVLGTTINGFLTLVLALSTKSLYLATIFSLILLSALSIVFWKKIFKYLSFDIGLFKKISIYKLVEYASLAIITLIVLLLAYQSMVWIGGFPYGILKGWGDGAYHMDMIRVLAESNPFSLQHPIAGGTPLTYTFFINFLSAVLIKMGASFSVAWHLPIFIFGIGLVTGLWNVAKTIIKKPLLRVAIIIIVLFGGGLGIFIAPSNTQNNQAEGKNLFTEAYERVVSPNYEYTHMDLRTGGKPESKSIDENIVWITPVISFFSHQRSFMPGAALFFMLLSGISIYWNALKRINFWNWFIISGFIPISHLHTTIAVIIIGIIVLVINIKEINKKNIVPIIIAVTLALPQLIFLLSNSMFSENSTTSVQPWFGWMVCEHDQSWFSCDPNTIGTDTSLLWFWLKNFGVLFILWIFSFPYIRERRVSPLFTIFVSGVIIFILSNIIKFQPWEFDNNKLIFFWWYSAAFSSIYLIEKIYNSVQKKYKIIAIPIISALIIGSVISGVTDVFARINLWTTPTINKYSFDYFGKDELKIATFINENTNPNSVIVTSSEASQFIPMTTGRAIYIGFNGWLWTQGRAETSEKRRKNIENFLITENPSVLCNDGATHIYINKNFIKEYYGFIDKQEMNSQEKIYKDDFGTLYSLKCSEK